MLYKKKLIFHKYNYNVRFKGKLPTDISTIILIRDFNKCRDCSFNSLVGLECKRWLISHKSKFIRSSLYELCINLSLRNKSNLQYRVKLLL